MICERFFKRTRLACLPPPVRMRQKSQYWRRGLFTVCTCMAHRRKIWKFLRTLAAPSAFVSKQLMYCFFIEGTFWETRVGMLMLSAALLLYPVVISRRFFPSLVVLHNRKLWRESLPVLGPPKIPWEITSENTREDHFLEIIYPVIDVHTCPLSLPLADRPHTPCSKSGWTTPSTAGRLTRRWSRAPPPRKAISKPCDLHKNKNRASACLNAASVLFH